MKIKFPNMKLHFSKLFCKLVLSFPSFPLSFPVAVAYAYAPSLPGLSVLVPALWILDALLSLGVQSAAKGNAGSTLCGICPTECPFLTKILTPDSSTAPWLWWDQQLLFPLELSSKEEKSTLPLLDALLLLYNTGDAMKGLFSLFKGLFVTNAVLMELETCLAKRDSLNCLPMTRISISLNPTRTSRTKIELSACAPEQ